VCTAVECSLYKRYPISTGAILFAVVGAKLSEGLNFSDDLARLVVVVGLPFANLTSPELQERLKHADRSHGEMLQHDGKYGKAGTELYESLCMNAVNQSIGKLEYRVPSSVD
jgi:chromosome transmission fidelity protein 1